MYRKLSIPLVALCLLAGLIYGIQAAEEQPSTRSPDCVYVPTPNDITAKMLDMAAVKKSDVLYDMGCGDGRFLTTAARLYRCKAVGYEIVPELVEEANQHAKKWKVDDLVQIKQVDMFTVDLSPASVIALYVLPEMGKKLIPQLEKLKPGSRIVAHDYALEGIKADQSITMLSNEDNVKHFIYLYTAPLKKE
jgi:cyclopropane fatty-acyl-phospholipid synthase-like methyltransferase